MLGIVPSLHFDGCCAEAMELYRAAFGAQTSFVMHYADADPKDLPRPLTEAEKQYVYHSENTFAGTRVMMADELDMPMQPGTAMILVITMDSREEVMQAFRVLEEGGRVIYPPHATAYSSCTCSLTDCYGFRWTIMTEQTER